MNECDLLSKLLGLNVKVNFSDINEYLSAIMDYETELTPEDKELLATFETLSTTKVDGEEMEEYMPDTIEYTYNIEQNGVRFKAVNLCVAGISQFEVSTLEEI